LPLTEDAQYKWGSRVEGVTFTNAVKEAIGIDGKNALEDRKARIPNSDIIRESFHSVKKTVTVSGNVRLDADATDAGGHADHWWAFCLARHAAKGPSGPVRVKSRPRRSQITVKGY
jgi:phage FluMu gp28-like protein